MPLVKIPAHPAPRSLGWLVPGYNCTQLGYDILQRAMLDVGILEVPNGSNRGKRLDGYAKRAGFPPPADPKKAGPYWCAIWAGCVLADCGCLVPANFAGTDYWLPYLVKDGKPEPGDCVLYGVRKAGPVVQWGDAHHIGIMARIAEPSLGQMLHLTIEGNRSYAGTASNNGVAVDIGPMMRQDILGYFRPTLAPLGAY